MINSEDRCRQRGLQNLVFAFFCVSRFLVSVDSYQSNASQDPNTRFRDRVAIRARDPLPDHLTFAFFRADIVP